MTDKVLEVLRGAREILTPENAWTQGSNAAIRNQFGYVTGVSLGNSEANCFCLQGAVFRSVAKAFDLVLPCNKYIEQDFFTPEAGANFDESMSELETTIRVRKGIGASVTSWNDDYANTPTEVLEVLDETIKRRTAA